MPGQFKYYVGLALVSGLLGCSQPGGDTPTTQEASGKVSLNQLSQSELTEGWVLMFDGKSTEGWRGYGRDSMPEGWIIDDGALHFVGGKKLTEEQKKLRGDIVFDQTFSDFTLQLEWKLSEAGNSGIFYLGQESDQYDYIWQTAPEMQVLDNVGHPDADKGKDGNRQAGSLYDLISAKPQNAKPVGQWNSIEITVNNRHVTHVQNGEVVVEYTLDTPEWQTLVATSKFPGLNETWAQVAQQGLIGLQDHDDPVWFRNIKIRRLN